MSCHSDPYWLPLLHPLQMLRTHVEKANEQYLPPCSLILLSVWVDGWVVAYLCVCARALISWIRTKKADVALVNIVSALMWSRRVTDLSRGGGGGEEEWQVCSCMCGCCSGRWAVAQLCKPVYHCVGVFMHLTFGGEAGCLWTRRDGAEVFPPHRTPSAGTRSHSPSGLWGCACIEAPPGLQQRVGNKENSSPSSQGLWVYVYTTGK